MDLQEPRQLAAELVARGQPISRIVVGEFVEKPRTSDCQVNVDPIGAIKTKTGLMVVHELDDTFVPKASWSRLRTLPP